MAFEAKWFWKMLWPGKKEPGPGQPGQEQAKPPLTPEEAYRKRMKKRRKAQQKNSRRRNRK